MFEEEQAKAISVGIVKDEAGEDGGQGPHHKIPCVFR